MGFLSKLSDWFNNTVIKATFDPAADELKQLYRNSVGEKMSSLKNTVGNIGGGLGNAVVSIPGVGNPIGDAFNKLKAESEKILVDAQHMTPDQIATANDKLKTQMADLEAQARDAANAEGISVEDYKAEQGQAKPFNINDFFNTIFTNTLYLFIFCIIVFLALLGSSLAANAAINQPLAFRIYYMIYGFILFPISIIMGIRNYMAKKQLFHAIWAPLHETYSTNKYMNILLFPFIYSKPGSAVSHFGSSLITTHPTQAAKAPSSQALTIYNPNAIGTSV